MIPLEPRRIKRIGLVIELEDGGRVMVYADDLKDAEITVTTDTPVERDLWRDGLYRPRVVGPPRTSILIEGLESYRITETSPAMANHMLEAMDHGVRPDDGGPYIGLRP